MAIFFDTLFQLVAPEIARQLARQLVNAGISPVEQFLPCLDFLGTHSSRYRVNEVANLTTTSAVDDADVPIEDLVSTLGPSVENVLTLLGGDTSVGDFTHYAGSYDRPVTYSALR